MHSWKGYEDHAWGSDELQPLTQEGKETLGGLGATIVDSLDTLWVMGLKDQFSRSVLSCFCCSGHQRRVALLSRSLACLRAASKQLRTCFAVPTLIDLSGVFSITGKVRYRCFAKGRSFTLRVEIGKFSCLHLYSSAGVCYSTAQRRLRHLSSQQLLPLSVCCRAHHLHAV